jgi:hypothetical protein
MCELHRTHEAPRDRRRVESAPEPGAARLDEAAVKGQPKP